MYFSIVLLKLMSSPMDFVPTEKEVGSGSPGKGTKPPKREDLACVSGEPRVEREGSKGICDESEL